MRHTGDAVDSGRAHNNLSYGAGGLAAMIPVADLLYEKPWSPQGIKKAGVAKIDRRLRWVGLGDTVARRQQQHRQATCERERHCKTASR